MTHSISGFLSRLREESAHGPARKAMNLGRAQIALRLRWAQVRGGSADRRNPALQDAKKKGPGDQGGSPGGARGRAPRRKFWPFFTGNRIFTHTSEDPAKMTYTRIDFASRTSVSALSHVWSECSSACMMQLHSGNRSSGGKDSRDQRQYATTDVTRLLANLKKHQRRMN